MIVLDLQSELNPQYKRLHSYYGQPFIWCMLHNFGGTLGLYGSAGNVNVVRTYRCFQDYVIYVHIVGLILPLRWRLQVHLQHC